MRDTGVGIRAAQGNAVETKQEHLHWDKQVMTATGEMTFDYERIWLTLPLAT
jgi:hypothetical protein